MNAATLQDALAQKADRMQRCIARAREELRLAGVHFASDFTRQDAAILNVQRACELAIDMANMFIAHHQWGLPRSAREAFALLGEHQLLQGQQVQALQHMVGFRNIAVHQYDALDMDIAAAVIAHRLDALTQLAAVLLQRSLDSSAPESP